MNCCRETVEMGVSARHREPARSGEAGGPPGNCPAYRGIGPEAYLDGTSQGEPVLSVVEGTPEDARKDVQIIRARSAPLSPASGFPVSWSQQVIHEISGLSPSPPTSSYAAIFDNTPIFSTVRRLYNYIKVIREALATALGKSVE